MMRWNREFDPSDRLYCSVAAAILGGGALGAGATIWGANKAADAQGNATNAAANLQKQVMGANFQQAAPWLGAGQDVLPWLKDWINPNSNTNPLSALIKLTTPGSNMTDVLKQTPGYQFTEDRGLRSVNNALSARGLGGSGGAVAKGAGDFVTGLASNTWQSVVNSLQNLFTGGAGAMKGLVDTGANVLGNWMGGAIKSGDNIGGALIGGGNAAAGGAMGTAGAIGNFGNTAGTAAILQRLLGNTGGGGGGGGGGIYGGNIPAEAGAWNMGNAFG